MYVYIYIYIYIYMYTYIYIYIYIYITVHYNAEAYETERLDVFASIARDATFLFSPGISLNLF